MAKEYLGDTIDIHGGGLDLIFPHHENEIAQSECYTFKQFVKYWIHNALINVNKEKMSKSLGNFFKLNVIFEKINPMVLRFYFLQHHYRTPIEFTMQSLEAAKTAYKKILRTLQAHSDLDEREQFNLEKINDDIIINDMLQSLCDDLNTPKFFGILFENLDRVKKEVELAFLVKSLLRQILGLTCKSLAEEKLEITPKIKELLEERKQARRDKNWKLADSIREKLIKIGYNVQDKKISG